MFAQHAEDEGLDCLGCVSVQESKDPPLPSEVHVRITLIMALLFKGAVGQMVSAAMDR